MTGLFVDDDDRRADEVTEVAEVTDVVETRRCVDVFCVVDDGVLYLSRFHFRFQCNRCPPTRRIVCVVLW